MTGSEIDAGCDFARDLRYAKIDRETGGLHPPAVHGKSAAGNDADGVGKCRRNTDAGKAFDAMRLLHHFGAEQDGAAPGTRQRKAGGTEGACFVVRRVAGQAEKRGVRAFHASAKDQGNFWEVGNGFGGDQVEIFIGEIFVFQDAANIGNLAAHDETRGNRRNPVLAFFPEIHFAVNNVESTAPERAKAGIAAALMQVAGVAKFDAMERAHGHGDLVEAAENWSAVEIVIGNDGQSETTLLGRRSVGQGRNKDTDLTFPVEALRAAAGGKGEGCEEQQNERAN